MSSASDKTTGGGELLVDGGFETSSVRNNTWTTTASVGGWKSDTGIETWGKNFMGVKATEGNVIAELDADRRLSNLYQDVKTVAGTEYEFSFDFAKRADSAKGSDTILVYWNGKKVGAVDPMDTSWSRASFKVVGTGGTDRIEFREEEGDNDSYGGLIDNASLKSTGRVEKEAAEKAAAEKAAAEKAAAEKAAAERAAAEKAAAERAAAEKAAAEKAAAEKAAAEKAAAEKAAAEKAAAEKAAAEKAAAEKAAAEKAAAEKAAAEKAAAEKAAAEKAAAEKAAAEKAAAEKAAAEKVGVDIHIGDGSKNTLAGWEKSDSIVYGEGGNDDIRGGSGNDRLYGGGGDDKIDGEDGDDTMFGSTTLGGKVDMTKLKIAEDTVAKVTFNYESAGYKNTLGMYKIGADGAISGVQVLFANASLKGSGGDLIAGKSSVDVAMKAGEQIGFFVVPDGFSRPGMAKLLSDTSATFKFVGADGKPGNVFGGKEMKLVQVSATGVETVVQSAYGSSVFHSVDDGTMGLNGDRMKHVVGTVNTLDGTVQVGFEDLKGGGDKDFDDSVFTVSLGTINTALLAKEATKAVRASDHDDMKGGAGNDKMFGMADNDRMDGGAGDDQMWGNSGDDTMHGGAGNDMLSGGKGNDVLDGGDGDDIVLGNSGDDVMFDSAGNDTYVGGAGFDTLDFSLAKAGVRVDMSKGTATGNGSDTFKSVERVVGSAFADDIKGSTRADTIVGGAGDDTIRGMAGADKLSGGEGKDTFVWLAKDLGSGVDHITDFSVGDRLDLSEIVKGQAASDAVRLTDGAAGVTVSVKVGGAFVDVVTLENFHATDLVAQGLILS